MHWYDGKRGGQGNMNNMYKIKIRLTDMDKIKKFIKTTNKYKSDIDILTDRAVVDAKSILGVYALNLGG